MTPETTRAVDQALAKLPLDDRVFALIANIITRRPQAVPAVLSMLAVTTAMTRYLPFATRVQLAELLRDAADEVERMRQKVANWVVTSRFLLRRLVRRVVVSSLSITLS